MKYDFFKLDLIETSRYFFILKFGNENVHILLQLFRALFTPTALAFALSYDVEFTQ